ncbi:ABC transporter permease [Streptomyces sp. SID13666]|uniref:ABC transporter permease n=1 Tax=Streptomyces TaxID=1883 RepID=UPI0011075BCA|nr:MULTISPECIES: ABC transporter permease [Streptomyces]MCZ4095098.1 ABC transporter permease [Streptomyces sp. H39-C1]NEA52767.1 ABC transporter permease [Streptomyces sp. SID13666]NEA69906.1 ABC transporter permease [Streptomyces sp. SID13588]QNA71295.1 ABC transporter permease [Streptomyces sp. So13.3]
MSTITSTRTPVPSPVQGGRPVYRVTARRVLRSEWAKLWSLRSTWITLGLGLLFLVAFGLIASWQFKSRITSGRHMDGDFASSTAVSLSLFGTNFAQLALGVLGVLVTAGEYSTGMIRSTLAAVPRRLPVLWSKSAVFGAVALVVGTVGAFVAFLFGSGIVSGTPAALSISDPGVVRSLLAAGLYLGLIGVLGTALGALLRSVAGGISVLVGSLMLVPGLISLLPSSWQDHVRPYLPSEAGASMFALHHEAHTLTPTAGLLVFLAWTGLAMAGASWRLMRTDA